ncbi:hypothetical protein BDQ17DRAFT_1478963 [Cyathus striatus]|nr:hypothetical protein BDQ17DRAFT_1478963 [Cyathus striatus]
MNEPPGTHPCVTLTGLTIAEYLHDIERRSGYVVLHLQHFHFTQAGSEVSAHLEPTLSTDMGSMYMIFYFYLGYLHAC